jgi:hypothetical protein
MQIQAQAAADKHGTHILRDLGLGREKVLRSVRPPGPLPNNDMGLHASQWHERGHAGRRTRKKRERTR